MSSGFNIKDATVADVQAQRDGYVQSIQQGIFGGGYPVPKQPKDIDPYAYRRQLSKLNDVVQKQFSFGRQYQEQAYSRTITHDAITKFRSHTLQYGN